MSYVNAPGFRRQSTVYRLRPTAERRRPPHFTQETSGPGHDADEQCHHIGTPNRRAESQPLICHTMLFDFADRLVDAVV
jgi:hypothetical protein